MDNETVNSDDKFNLQQAVRDRFGQNITVNVCAH